MGKCILVFFVVLAILIPVVFAVDTLTFENCETLGIEDCDKFRNLALSTEEQKKMMVTLLQGESGKDKSGFIYDWNNGLAMTDPPELVSSTNHETISNAWLSITAIMSSVLYDGDYYSDSSGTVQTNYHYVLGKPSNYFNGHWHVCGGSTPTNELGDCRTQYSNDEDNSYLDVYLNGNKIGNNKLTSYATTTQSNQFESKLHIKNKIKRKHYKWESGSCCDTCCDEDDCWCCEHYDDCEYSSTDYITDELVLSDSKQTELIEPSHTLKKLVYDKDKLTAYFIVDTANLVEYELKIGDTLVRKSNVKLDYSFSSLPYNILTLEAVDKPTIVSNTNIIDFASNGDEDLIVFHFNPDKTDCSFKYKTFFKTLSTSCNLVILPKVNLTIDTEEYLYKPDEQINVTVEFTQGDNPVTGSIVLRYGDQTKTLNIDGIAETSFTAKPMFNTIYADYETDMEKGSSSASKNIHVYVAGRFPIYHAIFWSLIFFFAIFIIIKKTCKWAMPK